MFMKIYQTSVNKEFWKILSGNKTDIIPSGIQLDFITNVTQVFQVWWFWTWNIVQMLLFVNWKNDRKETKKCLKRLKRSRETEIDRHREREKYVQNFAWLIKESIVYRFMIRFLLLSTYLYAILRKPWCIDAVWRKINFEFYANDMMLMTKANFVKFS